MKYILESIHDVVNYNASAEKVNKKLGLKPNFSSLAQNCGKAHPNKYNMIKSDLKKSGLDPYKNEKGRNQYFRSKYETK